MLAQLGPTIAVAVAPWRYSHLMTFYLFLEPFEIWDWDPIDLDETEESRSAEVAAAAGSPRFLRLLRRLLPFSAVAGAGEADLVSLGDTDADDGASATSSCSFPDISPGFHVMVLVPES